jgi:hypothetical protein
MNLSNSFGVWRVYFNFNSFRAGPVDAICLPGMLLQQGRSLCQTITYGVRETGISQEFFNNSISFDPHSQKTQIAPKVGKVFSCNFV